MLQQRGGRQADQRVKERLELRVPGCVERSIRRNGQRGAGAAAGPAGTCACPTIVGQTANAISVAAHAARMVDLTREAFPAARPARPERPGPLP